MSDIKADRALTEHFTFYQLTRTDQPDLQEMNRNVTAEEEAKLVVVAELLEKCREVLGCELDVHSGRRFLTLNKRVGGSERSQHLRCEAADISPRGPDDEKTVTDAWQSLITASRAGRLKFGQLILESDGRGREGRVWWVHISLGVPFRNVERCGEVLTMVDGRYAVIARIV